MEWSPLSLYSQVEKLFKETLISPKILAASADPSNPLYQSFSGSSILHFQWIFIFLLILVFVLIFLFTLLPQSVGSCLPPVS